jgi:hypothetical protein
MIRVDELNRVILYGQSGQGDLTGDLLLRLKLP